MSEAGIVKLSAAPARELLATLEHYQNEGTLRSLRVLTYVDSQGNKYAKFKVNEGTWSPPYTGVHDEHADLSP